ncbi:ABC transporter ATP-binding protein [Roseobacter insulae]|uniref:ABC transporter ATP-binding protein n=1 Tax=Roseobacter insulae TaxID=2859783 RepID=UPI0027E3BE92|nr:ATP-binding cassette domain-containing protein [Roseobacter insulae]
MTDLSVRTARHKALLEVGNLKIDAGAAVGIRGPSGAGKSTLLSALAGLTDRTSGTIRWGDTDILSLSRAGRSDFRASTIGFVFQDHRLFEELSPLQNASLSLMYAPKSERRPVLARAGALLSTFGVPSDHATVAPMSGGERQRIAVARALTQDPQIILADEPTANLDRVTAQTLGNDLLGSVRNAGKTLVLVSHDDALLARMDTILTLEHGRLL